jgi:hypothetical protein
MDALIKARLRQLQLTSEDDSENDERGHGDKELIYSRSKGKGKKSGRAKTAKDVAKKSVDWPQFHVYRGAARDTPAYDELTLQEFTAGYLAVVHASKAVQSAKDVQLLHLQRLMTDAQSHTWDNVRNFHGILLQQIEQRRLTWNDTLAIQELRAVYLIQTPADKKPAAAKGQQNAKTMRYCHAFQTGSCPTAYSPHDSDKGAGQVHHICGYCYRNNTFINYHAESQCRRKKPNAGQSTSFTPKNGQAESHQD